MALLSITETARLKLISYMEEHDLTGIQLRVSKAGCSGWRCSFEHFIGDTSMMASIPIIEGRHILVASDDMFIVEGMTVDYERKGLSSQFTFQAAVAQAYCGCGESFTV